MVVFDTAPTGHTLRLLNFPNLLDKGIEKIIQLKNKFEGILTSVNLLLLKLNAYSFLMINIRLLDNLILISYLEI